MAGETKEKVVTAKAKPVVTLAQKIYNIMSEVDKIPKNGYNSFQNYAYHRDEDIINAIREAFVKQGVIWVASCKQINVIESTKKDGSNNYLTNTTMEYTLIDVENPKDRMTLEWSGQGIDNGDKGLYKAFTGAGKTFLMKTFMISEGNDPEADEKVDRANAPATPNYSKPATQSTPSPSGPEPTEKQVDYVAKLCNDLGKPIPKFNTKAEANKVIGELKAEADKKGGK